MGRRGRNTHPRVRGGERGAWAEIVKENAEFESYYKHQNIVSEEEWEAFFTACKTQLPVTFRITSTNDHDGAKIRDSLTEEYIPYLKNIVWDGEEVEAPTPIAFYPDKLAWQIRVGKTVIRKSAPFARFQKFLVTETDVGNISRQEVVSMIPPLLLDVKPEHSVIDLCAAPGSKTAQIIEAVHAIAEPTGVVVANDSDFKRGHMLIHQVKRLNSPNLIVTNHDAQLFPRIAVAEGSNGPEYLKYDRVLCDVPCSGDGTMRKNINVWRDWNIGNGLGLHQTQINILTRGLHLLKTGGRLVYSTCSLNPVENEAVVAQILRTWAGRVKIVDCNNELPGLIRRKGMTSWKVMSKDKVWIEKPNEKIPASCFPQDDLKDLGIEHCMRVYPHDQDTGAFFITVFEKLYEQTDVLPGQPGKRKAENENGNEIKKPKVEKSEVKTVTDVVTKTVEKKTKLPRDANEEPFIFLPLHHPALDTCWEFYSISMDFPRSSLLVRNATGEPTRTIYYVHPNLRPIMELNETKLKLIHTGIKLFAFQKPSSEGTCAWRVQSEGLSILYRHISHELPKSRVIKSDLKTLELLCRVSFPKFEELPDTSMIAQLEPISEGCTFLEIAASDEKNNLVVPLWRGKRSVNLMLPKKDTDELLLRVFKNLGSIAETASESAETADEPGPEKMAADTPSATQADGSETA
ncbi:S-adenosyl-L-methionine-dependent methyltransferase [Lipomyces oligophaga]|uniref:S-adenosyl-L-methionine-dependent methyltransferase n=1 Tax=Lipomyces oligophaga TaxID=45792 RepID=UPI0034CD5D64